MYDIFELRVYFAVIDVLALLKYNNSKIFYVCEIQYVIMNYRCPKLQVISSTAKIIISHIYLILHLSLRVKWDW